MCLYELIMAWILEANIMNITKKLLVVAFSIISIMELIISLMLLVVVLIIFTVL